VKFIDEHKQVFGVEPVCRVLSEHGLQIAPGTYYAARSRPAPARTVRGEQLKAEIRRVWTSNYEVYGAQKVWLELNRQGIAVARCTVARLMRALGLQGVRRGRRVRTTIPGKDGHRAGDLLRRDFTVRRRTAAGSPISLTWQAGPGSSAWRSSSIFTLAPSWAGPPLRTSGPSWSWTPSTWRCGGVTGPEHRPGRA
jgi:putative transposase